MLSEGTILPSIYPFLLLFIGNIWNWRWKVQMFRFYHEKEPVGHASASVAEAAVSALWVTHYFSVTPATPILTPPNHNLQSIFCLASLMKLHIFCQITPIISPYCLVLGCFRSRFGNDGQNNTGCVSWSETRCTSEIYDGPFVLKKLNPWFSVFCNVVDYIWIHV